MDTAPATYGASWPTRKRFALSGRSRAFDPRVDAARGDLADIRLAKRLFAPHYAAALSRAVVAQAPLVAAIGAEPVSEVLVGERFEILEVSRGHAWGVSAVDGAVGYVPIAALGDGGDAAAIVCAPSTIGPDGTSLPMGSRIAAAAADDESVRPLGIGVGDFVSLAESLIGTPFKPGGRSGAGVDASGLIVLVLSIAGITAPRFVDLQAQTLGHPVAADAPLLRGDLLFVEDDVALVRDEATLIRVTPHGVATAPVDAFGTLETLTRRRLP